MPGAVQHWHYQHPTPPHPCRAHQPRGRAEPCAPFAARTANTTRAWSTTHLQVVSHRCDGHAIELNRLSCWLVASICPLELAPVPPPMHGIHINKGGRCVTADPNNQAFGSGLTSRSSCKLQSYISAVPKLQEASSLSEDSATLNYTLSCVHAMMIWCPWHAMMIGCPWPPPIGNCLIKQKQQPKTLSVFGCSHPLPVGSSSFGPCIPTH